MMQVSRVVYTFAAIREFARQEDTIYDEGWGIWPISRFTRKKVEIKIQQPQLVLRDQPTTKGTTFGNSRNIKSVIKLSELSEFIRLNVDILARIPNLELNSEKGDITNIYTLIKDAQSTDGDLREFDDRFDDTQLVYGILVNRDDQRITVVFRGSVSGGEDWSTNLKAGITKMETPNELSDFEKEIQVHIGFKEYLTEKYPRIKETLTEIFKQFPDYSLHVTGHSLGGALASLLAFTIASSGDLPEVKRPIVAVTIAAPMVGPDVFNEAYQELEKKTLVRLLRISSQGDLVPVVPPFPFNDPFNYYTQNGVNIHFMSSNRNAQVGYRNLKSFFSQGSFSPATNHSLKRYLLRLWQSRERFSEMKFQGLFQDHITKGFGA